MLIALHILALVAGVGEGCPAPDAGPVEPPPRTVLVLKDGPRMGQEALLRTVPPYPNMSEPATSVGDQIDARGVPMNVLSFMTNDPPRKVLDFYEAYFNRAGLPMVGNGDLIAKERFPYPSVTAMDIGNEIDVSVIAVPSEDHHTMVFVARADMKPLLDDLDRGQKNRFGGLAEYPSAIKPTAATFTDGEHQSTHVSFETADPPAKVLEFYAKAFASAGAEVKAGAGDQPGLTVLQGNAAWRLTARDDIPAHRTLFTAEKTAAASLKPAEDEPLLEER